MFPTLSARAEKTLSEEFGLTDTAVAWDFPREAGHGDLTTNVALSLRKKTDRKPQDIAEALAKGLSKEKKLVAKAEVAGAGYVNVWLKAPALFEAAETAKGSTKPKKTRKEAPVIIEYSGPNIAKPLAIHHIIGTVIGQATVNLYRHAGYPVIAWNYMGDWGTQFGKLAVAYEKWGDKSKKISSYSLDELLKLYVHFHNEAENDVSLEDQGRDAFRKLEAGDKELRAFWKDVVSVTKASLADIYKRLHVSFDLELGESFYEDKMDPVVTEGKKKKIFTEGKEGSLIVEFPEEKKMPPYLILKGDGATLYSTRDLAQMKYRTEEYKPQEILIFTDIAQKLHFEQLVETCKMLGWTLPKFENVLFGRMRFVDASMSTRKGNVLSLEHVVDEAVKRADEVIESRGDTIQTDDPKGLAEMIGAGALVYSIVSQNRKMEMVFDWGKMLSFEGNSAPYLQYTHARARSVLRKGEAEKGAEFPDADIELSEHERGLLKQLLQFPRALEEARANRMPHTLATYLFQLAQNFNAFYNTEPIVKAEGDARTARLALTSAVADILRSGAELLTLRVPDRM